MKRNLEDLSVIIPFKDKSKMTADCVNSLQKIVPGIHEVLLISNGSSPDELAKIKEYTNDYKNVKILEYDQPFNYQKINNWAEKQSSGKLIFFLNNDTELVEESRSLVEGMCDKAQEPDVGIVGCLLLYGDQKTIQHAGVYIRPGLLGDHLYIGKLLKKAIKNTGAEEFPYDITKSRPLSAVTGAAQVVERKKFDAVNGFNEDFIIAGGDVDLCLRLNQAGYQSWYYAEGAKYIIHKESQSRAFKPVPYNDFYHSYLSYIKGYDLKRGDPFLPEITEKIK